MKKNKMNLTTELDLTREGTAEMTRWCILIALHQSFGVGAARLNKILARAEKLGQESLDVAMTANERGMPSTDRSLALRCSWMPEGVDPDFRVPVLHSPRTRRQEQLRMAGNVAASMVWTLCAKACMDELGFGAGRLNRLKEEALANYRQVNEEGHADGLDVAMEHLRRCAQDALKEEVTVDEQPDEDRVRQSERDYDKVVVTDGQGGTATRTWTFTRVNSAPVISGADTNLGDKNIGFTYTYTVDDADGDTVTVVEKLNDETIRTLNNAPKGEQLSISITSEKLYTLGLNTVNNLVIEASDGQGGTSYRRLTFKRTNSAPSISGEDKDLGQQTGSFAETYTVTDVEGDNVVVTEFVDDQEIRSYQATLGEEETIELSREKWLTLTNGAHQLRVEAVDGNFATSVRVWNFSKKETVIKFQFAKPEETDARATKILITPTWKIEGSVAKVEACNNAFDAAPTWEDITAQVAINRVFNFTNESKTAEKWGVDVRFTITKNEGYEGEVSISGFGGAYE